MGGFFFAKSWHLILDEVEWKQCPKLNIKDWLDRLDGADELDELDR